MKGTHALLERARAQVGGADDTAARAVAGVVGTRHHRPSARAVVGGLLVALAAVAAFVVAMPRQGATTEYVVAARAVDPGATLTPADLRTVAIDLPAPQASLAFTDVSALEGTVALTPLTEGQILQASGLGRGPLAPFELSISLDADRALDGRLNPGERVAVLATYGSGPDATTLTVASTAQIERVSKPTGLAVGTAIVVTVGLDSEADADAVAHAARAGELTLVRAEAATSGLSYQPRLGDPFTDEMVDQP